MTRFLRKGQYFFFFLSLSLVLASSNGDSVMDHLLDVTANIEERQNSKPLFWHIHKAGGTTLHDFLSLCLNLTVAAEVGIKEGHDQDQELAEVIIDERKYINVDTTTPEGIERAAHLGFLSIHENIDVIISPLILPAATNLFSTSKKGMMFALLRHPVERVISLFYYLKLATWEPTYTQQWANMTLMEYIQSNFVESNWMVRFLVGKPEGFIDEHELEAAKQILREKCWIGLQSHMAESIARFGELFHWNLNQKWDLCIDDVRKGKTRSNSNLMKEVVDPNSEEWILLRQLNDLDLKLYHYAKQLYSDQGYMYFPQFQNQDFTT